MGTTTKNEKKQYIFEVNYWIRTDSSLLKSKFSFKKISLYNINKLFKNLLETNYFLVIEKYKGKDYLYNIFPLNLSYLVQKKYLITS